MKIPKEILNRYNVAEITPEKRSLIKKLKRSVPESREFPLHLYEVEDLQFLWTVLKPSRPLKSS